MIIWVTIGGFIGVFDLLNRGSNRGGAGVFRGNLRGSLRGGFSGFRGFNRGRGGGISLFVFRTLLMMRF